MGSLLGQASEAGGFVGARGGFAAGAALEIKRRFISKGCKAPEEHHGY